MPASTNLLSHLPSSVLLLMTSESLSSFQFLAVMIDDDMNDSCLSVSACDNWNY